MVTVPGDSPAWRGNQDRNTSSWSPPSQEQREMGGTSLAAVFTCPPPGHSVGPPAQGVVLPTMGTCSHIDEQSRRSPADFPRGKPDVEKFLTKSFFPETLGCVEWTVKNEPVPWLTVPPVKASLCLSYPHPTCCLHPISCLTLAGQLHLNPSMRTGCQVILRLDYEA